MPFDRSTRPSPDALRAHEALLALAAFLAPACRRVRTGDTLFRAGDRCQAIHVLDAGLVRLLDADGADAGFRFRGDWLGLESLVDGRHRTTAEAIDCCSVWSLRIDSLLAADLFEPRLVHALAEAVEHEDRPWPRADDLAAPAERRIALFLLAWADALVREGRDERRLGLRVTRAELGAYLRLPQHAVARAMGVLAGERAVDCDGDARREVRLDDLPRLRDYASGPGMR